MRSIALSILIMVIVITDKNVKAMEKDEKGFLAILALADLACIILGL